VLDPGLGFFLFHAEAQRRKGDAEKGSEGMAIKACGEAASRPFFFSARSAPPAYPREPTQATLTKRTI
jgi:hypothetical protein